MTATIEYTALVHVDMVEVRKLTAPAGLSGGELARYAEAHGYGDMVDVCDDTDSLVRIETVDGTVWEAGE